jgi:L-threonylcarbamoyladenylate synthase
MAITLHLDANLAEDIETAAGLLRAGKLVAFATETVYGLGANALSAEAVAEIFAAKQRPAWDPLIVHLASGSQLSDVTSIPTELAGRVALLAAAFWPGPLTLLLPRSAAIPDAVTAGRELVGVRVPLHPAAQALLRAAGVPVAAPSANLFGHTSPTTAGHVLADLDGRIAAVLDAGPAAIGLESTVLDPAQTPMVLYRPGAVAAEQLMAVTGVAVEVFVPASLAAEPEALPSPGVGIRHYAPRAVLRLTGGSPEALGVAMEQAGPEERVGVLLPDGWRVAGAAAIFAWGRWEDLDRLAAGLFAGLRALDDAGVTLILCPLPAAGAMGDAIRDRLEKAARVV